MYLIKHNYNYKEKEKGARQNMSSMTRPNLEIISADTNEMDRSLSYGEYNYGHLAFNH